MARPERGALHCPECGFVNPEGANYCQKCGAFLAGEAHETGEPGGGAGETTMAYQLDESGDMHQVDLERVAAERGTAVRSGGPTIEDVVREELRPLLKEWLDQHLPSVVERLVRVEIERVVGRALS